MSVTKNTTFAFGVQFQNVGETKVICVNDIFTIDVPKPGNSFAATVDRMQIWSSAQKKFINYHLQGTTGNIIGWIRSDATDKTKPTTDTVCVGDGVYFLRPGSANAKLTISGEVALDKPYVEVPVTKNTTKCMTYPFPIDIKIDDLRKYIDVEKKGNGFAATVDRIQKWNSTQKKYVNYYDQTGVGWVASDQEDKTVPTEDKILAGESFMFLRPGSANATFKFTKSEGL